MIRTFADVVRAFMDEEASKLAQFSVHHGPTIGDMYEGLSAEILNRALPDGLDLRVVSGFVVDLQGQISGQIDCMLVRGAGEKIPFTDTYKWPIADVLAVLEIKKTLSYQDMRDAFIHLRDVYESYKRWLDTQPEDAGLNVSRALRSFALMTGVHSTGKTDDMPINLQLLHYTLIIEQLCPVRIVWGYGGYKTQAGLRKAMTKMLEEALEDSALGAGFGVPCFPQMISCNGISLIKANGQPYSSRVEKEMWPFFVSSVTNPIWLMLELLWTRIENVCQVKMPFVDDTVQEAFIPFLSARQQECNGNVGWFYEVTEFKNLDSQSRSTTEWTPIELTAEQFSLVHSVSNSGKVDTTEIDFVSWLTKKGLTVEDFLVELKKTQLFSFDGRFIHPLFETLHTVITPQGKFLAAWNSAQLMKYLEDNKYTAGQENLGDVDE